MKGGDERAGHLLRRARVGAGMSQAELAFSAGVAQSVISAYEAGRRQPSLPTLAKLIDAAGCDLVVDIQHQPRPLSLLSGPVGRKIRRRRRDLVAAAAAHDVSNLRVFGSVARGEEGPDSDVDLLDRPAAAHRPARAGASPGRARSHCRRQGRPHTRERSQARRPRARRTRPGRAVTYRDRQRLADSKAAIDAIRAHRQRGDMSDDLVFDAVRIRLLEIGEAVKALPAEMLCIAAWHSVGSDRAHARSPGSSILRHRPCGGASDHR